MKRILPPVAFLILAIPCVALGREQAKPAAKPAKNTKGREQAALVKTREQSVLARVTVYWANGGSGSDRYTRQHKTATGVRLKSGHCAVDPRRIPYGSQVIFPDGRFLAVDTGTAVINRKAARLSGRTKAERSAPVVDRFFETKKQALAWEKTHSPFMTVKVVMPPSRKPGMSMQRMAEEETYPRAIPVVATATNGTPTTKKYPKATLVAKK
jgi:3D (Asp-Asp-Asp) domain-containing protein